METGLEGKPWWLGVVVGLGVGAVLLYAGHSMKLSGLQREITNQEKRLSDLESQIQRGEMARARLPEFRERVATLQLDLEKLLEILPNRRNVHILLRQVRALAEREDFNLVRFDPGSQIEQEFYSEWPIALNVQGTYHNLARFFDRMSRFSRIINVDNLNISPTRAQAPNRTINATFVAKTFVYKDLEGGTQGASP